MISISRSTWSAVGRDQREGQGQRRQTDGVWRFFVKIFCSFLKFLPGRDVDHLSICRGWLQERTTTAEQSQACYPDPAFFLINSPRTVHPSTVVLNPFLFPLIIALSFLPWLLIRENVCLFSFRTPLLSVGSQESLSSTIRIQLCCRSHCWYV